MRTFLSANLIGVSDIQKASQWYATVFGMTLVEMKPPYFCEMALGDNHFLIEKHSPERPVGFQNIPMGVRISAILGVEDIYKFMTHAKKHHVTIIHEPVHQIWGGWNAIIKDPDGNEIIIDQDN
ncbi:MAG TPA: VOC family protein [Candidatus Nanoarchaeia archaeon]|nr:VOC family protein [Candidatus Nanoarchaeia archaeon]